MVLQLQSLLKLSVFLGRAKEAKLPIKTTYKLTKLNLAIEQEIKFYQLKLREIFEQYCQKDNEGNFIFTTDGLGFKVVPELEKPCQSAITDLHNLEIELPDIVFTIEEFDGIELTMSELDGIMPFIVD